MQLSQKSHEVMEMDGHFAFDTDSVNLALKEKNRSLELLKSLGSQEFCKEVLAVDVFF